MTDQPADPTALPALLYGAIDRLTVVKGRLYLLMQGVRPPGPGLPAAEVRARLAAVDRDVDAAVDQLRRLEAAAAGVRDLQQAAAAEVAARQHEAAADLAHQQDETAAALRRQQADATAEVRDLRDRGEPPPGRSGRPG